MFTMPQERRKVVEIPIDKIVPNPSQPRRSFLQQELDGLASSIQANGLLQPISVRKVDGNYELIAGERRLRACCLAGLKSVACIVSVCDEKQSAIYAMLENLQRQDLRLFEEAEGIQMLIANWGVTQEEAAARLGKSQSTIANKLRLLRLSLPERQIICEAGLTERHARALLRIENESLRGKVLQDIIGQSLNVQQTDELVERILEGMPTQPQKQISKRTFIVKDIRVFLNTIDHAIETMKLSGINAITQKNETEEYIECVVRIPKHKPAETCCVTAGGTLTVGDKKPALL